MQILLPTSVHWNLDRFEDAEPLLYDPEKELEPKHLTAEAVVAWGNTSEQLEHMVQVLQNLRWVQGLAAGPDSLIRAGFAPEVILASGRGLHDQTVAEHALGMLLSCTRRLHLLRDAQMRAEWRPELANPEPPSAAEFISLSGARITIWGFGSIALTLTPLLQALGATVTGIATRSGTRGGVEVVATSDAENVLPGSDVLISILPKTDATVHMIDGEVLRKLPSHAWLVNVGRGGTVAEEDLLSALRNGTIAGAALDVFEKEPLPADSPLWSQENLIITPHVAGGRPMGAEELVLANLRRFLNDQRVQNLVDRERGY